MDMKIKILDLLGFPVQEKLFQDGWKTVYNHLQEHTPEETEQYFGKPIIDIIRTQYARSGDMKRLIKAKNIKAKNIKAFIDDTDDSILEEIYYDILDDIQSGDGVRYMQEDGQYWSYTVEDNRRDGFTVIVYNYEEEITGSVSYTYDEFEEISLNTFISEINEACYYAA